MKHLSIFLCIFLLSKNLAASDLVSFNRTVLFDGSVSKDALIARTIEEVKSDVISQSGAFLSREMQYQPDGASEYVIKRIAMNTVEIKGVEASPLVRGPSVYLEVTGSYRLNDVEYDNYVDAYFENDALRSEIEALAKANVELIEKLKDRSESGGIMELWSYQNDVKRNDKALDELIKHLDAGDLDDLIESKKRSSKAFAYDLSRAWDAVVMTATSDLVQLNIDDVSSDVPRWNAKHHFELDWTPVIAMLPSEFTRTKCSIFGNDYIMIELPRRLDGKFKDVLGKHNWSGAMAGGELLTVVAGRSNICGAFHGAGRHALLLVKGSFETQFIEPDGAAIKSSLSDVGINKFDPAGQPIHKY